MIDTIEITEADFEVGQILANMRQALGAEVGALVTFTGLVRDHNYDAGDDSEVATLTLEHYPGMTEQSIAGIVSQAEKRWPLLACHVVHRVGTLQPADQIMMVAVASAHRDAAFAAAEFVMDYLKTDAVFWKKEHTAKGSHWVQSTNKDIVRARKWREGA